MAKAGDCHSIDNFYGTPQEVQETGSFTVTNNSSFEVKIDKMMRLTESVRAPRVPSLKYTITADARRNSALAANRTTQSKDDGIVYVKDVFNPSNVTYYHHIETQSNVFENKQEKGPAHNDFVSKPAAINKKALNLVSEKDVSSDNISSEAVLPVNTTTIPSTLEIYRISEFTEVCSLNGSLLSILYGVNAASISEEPTVVIKSLDKADNDDLTVTSEISSLSTKLNIRVKQINEQNRDLCLLVRINTFHCLFHYTANISIIIIYIESNMYAKGSRR